MSKSVTHTFHIPVMGLGFSIDTPLNVAPYGISSVISLVDDMLIERMRELYSKKLNIPFKPISIKDKDHRAERIKAYLDLMDDMVQRKFEEVKQSVHHKGLEIKKYMDMLPDFSKIKNDFQEIVQNSQLKDVYDWVQDHISAGSIDVNIMTKLDKENYYKSEKLSDEYNDAHAALRGFAESKLDSSLVLSAGMNPKLYGYLEQFEDFYPNSTGYIKKKVTLKVSDYRSALIQGKFLAKKGIWVSEFRVESGLNCGGHAFATDGYLMGPILEEFKNSREELELNMYELYAAALETKNRYCPETAPAIKITAQGGVGTANEHQFLMDHYNLDSVGWGSPFLVVPEVSSIDDETVQRLCDAKEEDLYLSGISPLGVKFNNLRGNTQDQIRDRLIEEGNPGSTCPKQYAMINPEFGGKPMCSASKKFQKLKVEQLNAKELDAEAHQKELDVIYEKSCICVGLSNASLLTNDLDHKIEGEGVSVCPGPNMAYFTKRSTLQQMTDHIYGRTNLIERTDRPNLFIKELSLYIDFLKTKMEELPKPISVKDMRGLNKFKKNLDHGIEYYKDLFKQKVNEIKEDLSHDLEVLETKLNKML
ncbi:MAG: hypothetical protein JEZ03_01290 [Bacteroidales bacterium]|nr:hypothetical protein [Bacteroidales bacterium]